MIGNYDTEDILFTIGPKEHAPEKIIEILDAHPEIQFVSLVGIDIGGHDTDEKIPVKQFKKDIENMLKHGVQTDGSSVALPKIALLNNAKVDIIPDLSVNWYVDYNFDNNIYINDKFLPVGTLRIPSFLVHNESFQCGARVMLRDALATFKKDLKALINEHPYVLHYMDPKIQSASDIDEIITTSATELEFWVKTPEDKGDREQLFTAQVLKEQYWKRTYGDVRSALEETLQVLDMYGFQVEMGHKEVGGVKAKMGAKGSFNHVMEQLEIDWKYDDAMQAADKENHIKYVVRDIFKEHGLDVTFMAKPFEGVAGSGEHTHLGVAARLKNGELVNLFAPQKMEEDFMSPIGFGALMGLLKHYEVINPFVSSSNDSLNRLKPGYEAPVCTVTSLGISPKEKARNRTVLVGLIRDLSNPLSIRFELRSPNPQSNTYLVLAASYMAMLDGIRASLVAGKTSKDLEASISKSYGAEDFYLETMREYRSEKNLFDDYTAEERMRLFGKAPNTVWENLKAFDKYPDKLEAFKYNDVMPAIAIESYRAQVLSQWSTELHDRIIPQVRGVIRDCKKLHREDDFSDFDIKYWLEIDKLRHEIGKDSIVGMSLLSLAMEALENQDYNKASELQLLIKEKKSKLLDLYSRYKKNII